MSSFGDFAVSLPSDTMSFSVTGMLPVGLVDTRHLLVLADDVAPDEVEALALSLDAHAGWVGASRLQLSPGAELHGPWSLDAQMRAMLDLPEWATQVMLLDCAPQRSGPLPPELVGADPLADAFPQRQPAGDELLALQRLQAIARRLAGGLRLVADPPEGQKKPMVTLVVPDPMSSVGLTVFSPVWLSPDGAVAALSPVAPGVRPHLDAIQVRGATGLAALSSQQLESLVERFGAEVLDEAWRTAERSRQERGREDDRVAAAGQTIDEIRTGYGVVAPVDVENQREDWGRLEVRVQGAEHLPLCIRGEEWARDGVVMYSLAWIPRDPADAFALVLSRSRRRERTAARERVEAMAAALVRAVGGVAVDDDGFLVALEG